MTALWRNVKGLVLGSWGVETFYLVTPGINNLPKKKILKKIKHKCLYSNRKNTKENINNYILLTERKNQRIYDILKIQ